MTIVTMGDDKYFDTILVSARQAVRLYPQCEFLLYDWGLSSEHLEALKKISCVRIINWRNRMVDVNRFSRDEAIGLSRRIMRKLLGRRLYVRPVSEWRRELALCEKCYCILDASQRTEGAFLFLDADAFLNETIDELVEEGRDVCVTVRPLKEIHAAKARGSRHDINSGVVFFSDNKEKRRLFLIEWIKEMNVLNILESALAEQTALSNLVLRCDQRAFEDGHGHVNVRISGSDINCGILPTEVYNYSPAGGEEDLAGHKIIHLKSGRELTHAIVKQL